MVGGAFLTTAVVFSFASGIFHPYYVSFLAPWAAMLVGAGAGLMLPRSLGGAADGRAVRVIAPLAIAAGAITELVVLGELDGAMPWAKPVVIGIAGACAILLAIEGSGRVPRGRRRGRARGAARRPVRVGGARRSATRRAARSRPAGRRARRSAAPVVVAVRAAADSAAARAGASAAPARGGGVGSAGAGSAAGGAPAVSQLFRISGVRRPVPAEALPAAASAAVQWERFGGGTASLTAAEQYVSQHGGGDNRGLEPEHAPLPRSSTATRTSPASAGSPGERAR